MKQDWNLTPWLYKLIKIKLELKTVTKILIYSNLSQK